MLIEGMIPLLFFLGIFLQNSQAEVVLLIKVQVIVSSWLQIPRW